jgi:polyisoprenoid-binding protein YceI
MRVAAAAIALLSISISATDAQSVSTDPRHAPTGAYTLEPRHAQIQFAIAHLGITDFLGRFDKASGTLNFNASDPARSSVSITIDLTSLDTQNHELNSELQGPAIFDIGKSPTATFKSTAITRAGPNTGKITGDLTIKGITKPVTLDATFNGTTSDPLSSNTTLIGFHATTTIRRSDFDMTGTSWTAMIGDDVKLDIEAPFMLQKE